MAGTKKKLHIPSTSQLQAIGVILVLLLAVNFAGSIGDRTKRRKEAAK